MAIETQAASAWGPTWSHLRDTAKPVQPRDVYDLRAVRTFEPPSKAHLKRIFKLTARPEVQPAREPKPVDVSQARARHAEASQYGALVRKLVLPPVGVPLPKLVPAQHPTGTTVEAGERKDPDYMSNFMRQERERMLRMSRMVYSDFKPTLDQIQDAFGSVERWEQAKRDYQP